MKIMALGVGDGFTKTGTNTSFLLEADKKYLIDCPKELMSTLEKYNLDINKIDDVILTHVHGDHIGDIQTLAFYKLFAENKKINLYTTDKIYHSFRITNAKSLSGVFDKKYKKIEIPFENYFNFIKLNTVEDFQNNNIEIKIRNNWHPIPTIGLKITYDNKSVGLSGDTLYDPALIEKLYDTKSITKNEKDKLLDFLWDSDMIIHEATYKDNREEYSIHTYVKRLEKKSEEINKPIYLAHIPDNLKTMLETMKPGELYKIG